MLTCPRYQCNSRPRDQGGKRSALPALSVDIDGLSDERCSIEPVEDEGARPREFLEHSKVCHWVWHCVFLRQDSASGS